MVTGRRSLDELAAEQGVQPVSDPAALRIPGLTDEEAASWRRAIAADHIQAFVRGWDAGAEASARTVLAVAAEWDAPAEQAGAVRLFADMVATAIREASKTVTEEGHA